MHDQLGEHPSFRLVPMLLNLMSASARSERPFWTHNGPTAFDNFSLCASGRLTSISIQHHNMVCYSVTIIALLASLWHTNPVLTISSSFGPAYLLAPEMPWSG